MRELSTRLSGVCKYNACQKNLLFTAGYGTYLEDLFSKDTDPSFARMAAEYGATFQKTNTVRNVVARN